MRAGARVSRAIMPADVYDFISFYRETVLRSSVVRVARNLCAQIARYRIPHFSIPGTETLCLHLCFMNYSIAFSYSLVAVYYMYVSGKNL